MSQSVETRFVEYMDQRMRARLTGQSDSQDQILGEPRNLFFVGVLADEESAHDNQSRLGRKLNPYSLRLEFLLDKLDVAGARLQIQPSFHTYYRVFPTYPQQVEVACRQRGVKRVADLARPEAKKARLAEVFRRLQHQIAPIEVPLASVPGELEQAINADLLKGAQRVLADPQAFRLYRGNSRANTANLDLTHVTGGEAAFGAYLASFAGHKVAPAWRVGLEMEAVDYDAQHLLYRVTLWNRTEKDDFVDHRLYNANLVLTLEGATFQPFSMDYLVSGAQAHAYAKTVNCVAEWEGEAPHTLRTTHLPVVRMERVVPLTVLRNAATSEEDSLPLQFAQLAKEPVACLVQVEASMQAKLDQYQTRGRREPANERVARGITRFAEDLERFRAGLALLQSDPKRAGRAFVLLNRTMQDYGARNGMSGWRLYQLVFIVCMIPDMYHAGETDCSEQVAAWLKQANVLHVATGGGKTFAYFGLVIFSVFLERLRGKQFGVTAWVKFPLRMLSLQQLEIVIGLATYAERTRQVEAIAGDPITVGYYVGSGNTPNRVSEAFEQLEADPQVVRRWRICQRCPLCGGEVAVRGDKARERIVHQCTASDCGVELPVLITDTEIYRHLPPVLISTLDKVTVFSFNPAARLLLGAGSQGHQLFRCSKHGFSANGKWCIDVPPGASCQPQPVAAPLPTGPLLVVQDELHMVRESMGTLDSHFETAIAKVIAEFTGRAPKYIAATATVEGVVRQVDELYDRVANTFPSLPYGPRDDFFFAGTGQLHRIVTGLLPTGGKSVKWGQQMVMRWYWEELQAVLTNLPAVAGKLDVPAGDLKAAIVHNYALLLAYFGAKRDLEDFLEYLQKVDNPELEGWLRVPPVRTQALTGELSMDEIRGVMDQIEGTGGATDLIAATKIISHGVDFRNLNVMSIQGMPRNISELIQAMSRAGRTYPALIYLVLHTLYQRDQSYYHYYYTFMRNLDSLVEQVPLSRFARNAVNQTAANMFTMALATKWSQTVGWELNKVGAFQRKYHDLDRGALCADVDGALLSEHDQQKVEGGRSHYSASVDRLVSSMYQVLLEADPGSLIFQALEQRHFPVLRGLRAHETQVSIQPSHEARYRMGLFQGIRAEVDINEDGASEEEQESTVRGNAE